jgi:hypothetical protein
MIDAIAWIVGGILSLLSGIHLYWAAGGSWGGEAAVPSNGMAPLFRSSKTNTILVAVALALSGWFVLEFSGAVKSFLFSEWLLLYGGWALSVVFLLRAVGDFRWLGFFKKQTNTLFAKWDTRLHSPLCLFLGVELSKKVQFENTLIQNSRY